MKNFMIKQFCWFTHVEQLVTHLWKALNLHFFFFVWISYTCTMIWMAIIIVNSPALISYLAMTSCNHNYTSLVYTDPKIHFSFALSLRIFTQLRFRQDWKCYSLVQIVKFKENLAHETNFSIKKVNVCL